MAPKQAGRHVSTQLEREAQGLKWKSASTIDRQRAQKKKRKQKKRQRKQMAETADWQNPPTPQRALERRPVAGFSPTAQAKLCQATGGPRL